MKKVFFLVCICAVALLVCTKNTPPEILAINADPDSINAGDSTTLTVSAMDEDGELLNYLWSCDYGSFSTTTESITIWTAPVDNGVYSISVVVTDEDSAAADTTVDVRVIEVEIIDTLPPPNVSYEVLFDGDTLRLSWPLITGAAGYYIYVDSLLIDSVTVWSETLVIFYDAITPAALYEITAYNDTYESERDQINCRAVLTNAVTIYGTSDPNPDHPNTIGFNTSGTAVAYPMSDTVNWPNIDYIFDDMYFVSVTLASPNSYVPPYNAKKSAACDAFTTNFDGYVIAEALGVYTTQTQLAANAVYSLYMDPDDSGWDNQVDHFAKMKVESISGINPPCTIVVRLGYQPIPGLRWLVTQ